MSNELVRGRPYRTVRRLIESVLALLYLGDWPKKLWGRFAAAKDVRCERHELRLHAQPLSAPLRLAFASDLHFGPTTADCTLARAAELLRQARPSVLVLGGDFLFLDATPQRLMALQRWIEEVPADLKVAVLGNHDLWTDYLAIERALDEVGVRVLTNEAIALPAPHDDISLVGIDDPWVGVPDATAAFAQATNAKARIAVCHSPAGLPLVAPFSPELFLCGHTHGGQIALPGPRPIVVPGGPIARRHPHGLHRVHDMWLYVSRGVGGVELPMRLNAPPDVALFDVR